MNESGFIYILINPSMEGVIKVGTSKVNPQENADELSEVSGVTTRFIVAYQMKVDDCNQAESFIFSYLEEKGYKRSGEFYVAPLNIAIDGALEYKALNTDVEAMVDDGIVDVPLVDEQVGITEPQSKKRIGCIGWLGIAVGIIVILIGGCSIIDSNNASVKMEKNYQNGLELLKEHKYHDASIVFVQYEMGEDYKDGKALYDYSQAEELKNSNPSQSEYYINQIPETYSGEFANEIKELRKAIKPAAEKQAQVDKAAMDEQQKYKDSHIYVGDGEYKVVEVFGEPQSKNRTVVGNTVHEQWVYGNGHYVYLENGVVVGWQD